MIQKDFQLEDILCYKKMLFLKGLVKQEKFSKLRKRCAQQRFLLMLCAASINNIGNLVISVCL